MIFIFSSQQHSSNLRFYPHTFFFRSRYPRFGNDMVLWIDISRFVTHMFVKARTHFPYLEIQPLDSRSVLRMNVFEIDDNLSTLFQT